MLAAQAIKFGYRWMVGDGVKKLTRAKINLIIQLSMYINNNLLAVNMINTSTTQIEIRSQKVTQMR
jgi:hypothetical protein